MTFTEGQAEEIKLQLFEQIANFPAEQKEAIRKQVESMSAEELEEFLIQNNLIKSNATEQSCIFCSITDEKISSYKIAETENAVAVLELNPISDGHVLIIPKTHISSKEIESQFAQIIQNVKEKISQELSPKDIELFISELFGHGIINLLPVYNKETPKSPRQKATLEKLKEVQEKFKSKPGKESPRETNEKISEIKTLNAKKLWLPRRIP